MFENMSIHNECGEISYFCKPFDLSKRSSLNSFSNILQKKYRKYKSVNYGFSLQNSYTYVNSQSNPKSVVYEIEFEFCNL